MSDEGKSSAKMSDEGDSSAIHSRRKEVLLNLISLTAPEYDFVSRTPHLHLAFILRTQLILESRPPDERWTELSQFFAEKASISQPDDILVSGSTAEGFFIPKYVTRDYQEHVTNEMADIDIMVVDRSTVVQNQLFSEQETGFVFDQNGCHLGYTKIEIVGDVSNACYKMNTERIGGRLYLSNLQKFSDVSYNLLEAVTKHKETKEVQQTNRITRQGPALTSETSSVLAESQMEFKSDFDIVSARKTVWPDMARNWPTRNRQFGWPSSHLIKDIIDGGCHVVAVAHAKSTAPSVEWRMSFSRAEILLAHSLSPFQRSCYRLFKMTCSAGITPKKVIASYFLKTTFFWLCEEKPEAFWQESNISYIIIALLEKLQYFLCRKLIPNFFIPENNMVDHILAEKLQQALESVCQIRQDPLYHVLSFSRKALHTPHSIPWHSTLQHAREDADCYLEHRSLYRTLDIFNYCLRRCAALQIAMGHHADALASFNTCADVIELRQTYRIPHRLAFAADVAIWLKDDVPPMTMKTQPFHQYLLSLINRSEDEAAFLFCMGYCYLVQGQLGVETLQSVTNITPEVIIKPVGPREFNEEPALDRSECLEHAKLMLSKARDVMEKSPITGHWTRSFGTQYLPNIAETTCRLAQVLVLQGHHDEAAKYLQEIIDTPNTLWITFKPYEKGLYDIDFILSTVFGISDPVLTEEDVEGITYKGSVKNDQNTIMRFSERLLRGRHPDTSCVVFCLYLQSLIDLYSWLRKIGEKKDFNAESHFSFSSDAFDKLGGMAKEEVAPILFNDCCIIKDRLMGRYTALISVW